VGRARGGQPGRRSGLLVALDNHRARPGRATTRRSGRQLRESNRRAVAVDDAGSGYQPAPILALHPAYVKLDLSWVATSIPTLPARLSWRLLTSPPRRMRPRRRGDRDRGGAHHLAETQRALWQATLFGRPARQGKQRRHESCSERLPRAEPPVLPGVNLLIGHPVGPALSRVRSPRV